MIDAIFLDMDGVLTNFMDHALALHGTSTQELDDAGAWPHGLYEVHEAMGITEDEFWAKIDASPEFWDGLPLYPWADALWSACSKIAPTLILSAPSMDWRSASGKMNCLQRWKGRRFREWIFAPAKHKHRLARQGALLIDDSDRNTGDWMRAGGEAILFP